MVDQHVDVSIPERIGGSGALVSGRTSMAVARFSLERVRHDPHSTWSFHAFADPEARWFQLLSGSQPITFSGTDDFGKSLSISELAFRRQSGQEFWADAQRVEHGPPMLDGDCKSQYAVIALWPTPLTDEEVTSMAQHWTGEMKPIPGSEIPDPEPVMVRVGPCSLRFSLRYEWENVSVAGQRATIRVPEPALTGEVSTDAHSNSPKAIADLLATQLDDALRVLSFASRRHVRWSRISIHTETTADRDTFTVIRGSRSSNRQRDGWPLLVSGRMPASGLQELIDRFAALQRKDSVSSAITYLQVARDSQFLEGGLSSVYTAFEAAVNALAFGGSEEFTIPSRKFSRLSHEVRLVIEQFSRSEDLSADRVDELIRKVPELHRRPILPRALDLLSRLAVDCHGIWPESLTVATGLGAILKRRNDFIHRGAIHDFRQASIDRMRLAILTELVLLKALEVPDAWIAPQAFEDLSYLRTLGEPLPADGPAE